MTCYRRHGEATTSATNSESGDIRRKQENKIIDTTCAKENEIYDVSAFYEGFQAIGSSFKRLVLRRPRYKVR